MQISDHCWDSWGVLVLGAGAGVCVAGEDAGAGGSYRGRSSLVQLLTEMLKVKRLYLRI